MIVRVGETDLDIGGPIGFLPNEKLTAIEALLVRALNLKINAFDAYLANQTQETQDAFLRAKRHYDYVKSRL